MAQSLSTLRPKSQKISRILSSKAQSTPWNHILTAISILCSGSDPKESEWNKFKDCASEQLGLEDLAELGAITSGQPIPGTKPFVTPGSSRGTSVAAMAADKVFGRAKFPGRVPTIVGGPGTGRALAIAGTRSVARFAGRAVPIVGWAMLAYDAASIAICTANGD